MVEPTEIAQYKFWYGVVVNVCMQNTQDLVRALHRKTARNNAHDQPMGRSKKPPSNQPQPPMAKRMTSPRPPIFKSNYASAISAPPPTSLPAPPAHWTRPAATEPRPDPVELMPPPIVLQRSEAVQKQLQGNLIFSVLQRKCGEELAAKVAGMLLELDADEREELLSDPAVMEARLHEAFDVLREAGDPRVPPSTSAAPAPPAMALMIDVASDAGVQGDGPLTFASSMAGLTLRISPRRTRNPYSTGNILQSPRVQIKA